MVAQPGIDRHDPDYYAARVLDHILAGSFGSRLFDALRVERGLTYGVSSGFSHYEVADFLTAESDLSNDNVGAALAVMREQWRDLADAGPSDAEVAAATDYLSGAFALSLTDTRSIARYVRFMQMHALGIDYLDRYPERIAAVSPDAVRGVAEGLLQPGGLVTVVVGDPPADALSPDMRTSAAALADRELAREVVTDGEPTL
jgi:zinc protease